MVERPLQFRQLRGIPIRLLQLDSLLHAVLRPEGALEHGCDAVYLTVEGGYRVGTWGEEMFSLNEGRKEREGRIDAQK